MLVHTYWFKEARFQIWLCPDPFKPYAKYIYRRLGEYKNINMTITWVDFALRLLMAFLLAVGIGIERQWLKTRAVLKTNVLVALGSAMFVMLSIMTPGDTSPTRISAQIVSGVGFLGGGVILREGASVRGINTAATLWCAAALGTLAGSGFFIQACVSTVAIVGANLLLRPLAEAFKLQDEESDRFSIEVNTREVQNTTKFLPAIAPNYSNVRHTYYYSCHLICSFQAETKVLQVIEIIANERNLTIVGIKSKSINTKVRLDVVKVSISFVSGDRAYLSDPGEIISTIKAEAEVYSVSWQSQFE